MKLGLKSLKSTEIQISAAFKSGVEKVNRKWDQNVSTIDCSEMGNDLFLIFTFHSQFGELKNRPAYNSIICSIFTALAKTELFKTFFFIFQLFHFLIPQTN